MPTREERRQIEKDEQDTINRLMDKYSDIKHSLWNALITLNSLLLSCVSILYLVSPTLNKTIVIFIFSFCLLAIAGIIVNYLITKSVYKRINSSIDRFNNAAANNNLKDFQAKEKTYYVKNYQIVEIIELCTIVFSAISLIIIFLVLIFSPQKVYLHSYSKFIEIFNFYG